jgi:DNA processing protein
MSTSFPSSLSTAPGHSIALNNGLPSALDNSLDSAITLSEHSCWQEDILIFQQLQALDGLGLRKIHALLRLLGSPRALWSAPAKILAKWLPPELLNRFNEQRQADLNPLSLAHYAQENITLIPVTSPHYPGMLKEIGNPPLVLYVKGNQAVLSRQTSEMLPTRALGVVGTRHISPYGQQVTEELMAGLAPYNPCIVSGLAAGVDTTAHWAALNNGLKTVAVFGCGLNTIYPVGNKELALQIVAQGGALVSEYPLGVFPDRFRFPQRNRIVSGLCSGVLVVEGSLKSGSLITARYALEEGRSVFAVPGSIFEPNSKGPLTLIQQGAVTVLTAGDIVQELNWESGLPGEESATAKPVSKPISKTVPQQQLQLLTPNASAKNEKAPAHSKNRLPAMALPQHLSETEQLLLSTIPLSPIRIDALAGLTKLSLATVSQTLTLLELEELVTLLPGATVCRK